MSSNNLNLRSALACSTTKTAAAMKKQTISVDLDFGGAIDFVQLSQSLQGVLVSEEPCAKNIKQQLNTLLQNLSSCQLHFKINSNISQENGAPSAIIQHQQQQTQGKQQDNAQFLRQEQSSNLDHSVSAQEENQSQEKRMESKLETKNEQIQPLAERPNQPAIFESTTMKMQQQALGQQTRFDVFADILFCNATNAAEHNQANVDCLQFCENIQELDNADGWAVSCSKGLLNLWKCDRAIADEQACTLMNMHSTEMDSVNSNIQIDADQSLLFGVGRNKNDNSISYVSAYSLVGEDMLATRGKVQLSDYNIQNATKVCSIHSLGEKLSKCLAIAAGPNISIVKIGDFGRKLKYRTEWCAHNNQITTELFLPHKISRNILLSGSSAGVIAMWDMRDKPQDALVQFQQIGSVSGIDQLPNGVFSTASSDCHLRIWDIRQNQSPINSFRIHNEGQGGIQQMAVSPQADMVAVVSMGSVYLAGIAEWNLAKVQRVYQNGTSNSGATCACWNTCTEDLYVGFSNGQIGAFKLL